jgi:hypothetical protein
MSCGCIQSQGFVLVGFFIVVPPLERKVIEFAAAMLDGMAWLVNASGSADDLATAA